MQLPVEPEGMHISDSKRPISATLELDIDSRGSDVTFTVTMASITSTPAGARET